MRIILSVYYDSVSHNILEIVAISYNNLEKFLTTLE